MKTIYLGGGCFWCTEAIFQNLQGVSESIPGYMGGSVANPSYESVSTGKTGHVEVIKVSYDEAVISSDDILDVFFATHDPTTFNAQGNDVGTQYRSVIFYTDEALRDAAQRAIVRVQQNLPEGKQVATEIASATEFYPAEEYHQNYYVLHHDAPYCQIVISPKIEKLQKKFDDKIRS